MPLDELPEVAYLSVPTHQGYRVGDDGSVWSKLRNSRNAEVFDGWHRVAGSTDKDGYKKVILCLDGRRKHVRVNVLILTVFCGPPPQSMANPTASHKNGNNADNRLTNLQWASQKDNIGDKVRHGTAQTGEKHPKSILTDVKVVEMRMMRKNGFLLREIAAAFRVKLVTAEAAISGRNWKHLPL